MTNFPNLTESCSSLPLGDGLNCVGSDQDPLHFTGKERDAATGLDNFGARFDSSSFGRFMSPDWSATIVPVPYASLTDPQSLNLYSYVENNPLSRTDPTGHCTADGEKHGFWWCVGHAMGFTETRKEYGARIAIERQWLMSNVAQNSGQVNDMRNASASQVDKVYWQWSEALRTAGCFFGCDEQPEAKDYYRNASGAFVLFRGGSSFAPKAGEFRVDAEGNVGATRGVSVNTDPLKVERFGGAFEIKYLPPELQLIQRGIDVGHFEIVPRQPMSVSRYLELLREIVVEGPKE
jgi:RHS repeat-associated protein